MHLEHVAQAWCGFADQVTRNSLFAKFSAVEVVPRQPHLCGQAAERRHGERQRWRHR